MSTLGNHTKELTQRTLAFEHLAPSLCIQLRANFEADLFGLRPTCFIFSALTQKLNRGPCLPVRELLISFGQRHGSYVCLCSLLGRIQRLSLGNRSCPVQSTLLRLLLLHSRLPCRFVLGIVFTIKRLPLDEEDRGERADDSARRHEPEASFDSKRCGQPPLFANIPSCQPKLTICRSHPPFLFRG